MTDTIPILPYNKHIFAALKQLNDLGDGGVARLRKAMSALIYRLSKILCDNDAPTADINTLLGRLEQEIEVYLSAYPELDAAGLRKALDLLKSLLSYSGSYIVEGVNAYTNVDATDTIAPLQDSTGVDTKTYRRWGRRLPFRPLFCLLGAFAQAFPVQSGATRYEMLPGENFYSEDSGYYDGGDDKPKSRMYYQRTFATLLDACDYQWLRWQGPIKSEPSYDAVERKPLMSLSPPQRPKRKGACYWRKDKGSISPDVAIIRRGHAEVPVLQDVTHVVDMKFGKDDWGRDQKQSYLNMFGGTRLYVLYFPDDCDTSEREERKNPQSDWVSELFAFIFLLGRLLGGGRSDQNKEDDNLLPSPVAPAVPAPTPAPIPFWQRLLFP